MIINLPNGKTIEVSAEVYLRMTDEDFEYLVSINCGDDVTNPFEASVLLYGEAKQDEEEEDETSCSHFAAISGEYSMV